MNYACKSAVNVWPIFQHHFGHEIRSRTLSLFATVYVCYRSKIIRHWHASLTPRIAFFHHFSYIFSLVTHLLMEKREKHDEIIPVQLSTLKGFISNGMLCLQNQPDSLRLLLFFCLKKRKKMSRKSGSVTKLPSQIYGYEHVNLNDFLVTPSIRWYNNMVSFCGNGMNWDDDAIAQCTAQLSFCFQSNESSRKEWKLHSSQYQGKINRVRVNFDFSVPTNQKISLGHRSNVWIANKKPCS